MAKRNALVKTPGLFFLAAAGIFLAVTA